MVLYNCCIQIPQRWIISILGFLAFFIAYSLCGCFPIIITQMVKTLNTTLPPDETCPDYNLQDLTNTTLDETVETFKWDEDTQGIILSSFFWGYVIAHIPGGLLAEKYGPKYIIGMGVFISSILSLLTPFATEWGDAVAMVAIRFSTGLCVGLIHPSMSTLLARWIPPQERSFIGSLVYNGEFFGIMISTAVSGIILSKFNDNWHFAFYFFGCIGVLWFFLWILFISDDPENNKLITEKEKKYIQEHIESQPEGKKPAFPWKRALTSKPFLALILMQAGSDWCNFTILSDLPKYMNDVLKLPVELNGYANSVPQFASWAFSIIISWVSDKITENKRVSITVVRKVNTALAFVGTWIMMSSLIHGGCDVYFAVKMMTIGSILTGSYFPGVGVNVLDLSPNYAGTLMGISNGVGGLCGIFAPYVVSVLAPDHALSEWRLIFWIVIGVYFVTTVNFIIFGSGEVQPWNDYEFLNEKSTKRKDLEKNRSIKELDRFNKPNNENLLQECMNVE